MRAVFVALVLMNIAYFVYRDQLYEPRERISVRAIGTEVESVYLLSENSNNSIREKEMDLVVNNPVKAVTGGTEECQAIGPFADLFAGQNVADQLNSVDLAVDLKAIDTSTGESDFRVMIPPASSLQEAFRKLRELNSQGIDSYVITEGDDALGISLGVFSTQEAALSQKEKLQSTGYEVEIVSIPTIGREFWIFPQTGRRLEVSSVLWASLLESHEGIDRQLRQCLVN